MNELIIKNDCITSLELAQFSNKEHKNLLESIRNMEQTWVSLGQPNFKQSYYFNSQNKKQPMYELSKTESLYIASKFSDEVRAKIILRWEELENQKQVPQVPATFKEALLLAGNNAQAEYDVKLYNGKFNAYQRTYVLTLKNKNWSLMKR